MGETVRMTSGAPRKSGRGRLSGNFTMKGNVDPETAVLSRPEKELPVCNAKSIRNCEELYLAKKGIERIHGFNQFVKLNTLWLNDNKIETIGGLEENFRLRNLYIQNNRIYSIGTGLRNNRFLQILLLSNNQLRDLERTVACLSHLHFLEKLGPVYSNLTHLTELFGNPLSEEHNYRLYVIHHIPSLQIFDRHVVTVEERNAAKALYVGTVADKIAFGKRIEVYEKPEIPPPMAPSELVKDMWKYIAKLERDQKREEDRRLMEFFKKEEMKVPSEAPLPKDINFASKLGDKSLQSQLRKEMPQELIDDLTAKFNGIDADGNGSISKNELADVVKDTDTNLDEVMLAMDFDDDGKISLDEFLRGYRDKHGYFDPTGSSKDVELYFKLAEKYLERGEVQKAASRVHTAHQLADTDIRPPTPEVKRPPGRFDTFVTYHFELPKAEPEPTPKSPPKSSIQLDPETYAAFKEKQARKKTAVLSKKEVDVKLNP